MSDDDQRILVGPCQSEAGRLIPGSALRLGMCGCMVWVSPSGAAFLDTDDQIGLICTAHLVSEGVKPDEIRTIPGSKVEREGMLGKSGERKLRRRLGRLGVKFDD